MNFVFHAERPGKIKNDKIQRWRMELGRYNYEIIYRQGKSNVYVDTRLPAHCGAFLPQRNLSELHNCLWYVGIIGLGHFLKARNLLYSIEDVKTYARTVLFVLDGNYVYTLLRLVKAAPPME